jgi:hypothetical protein
LAALNIGSIASGGDFAQTNNCGNKVAVGVSCTITVGFTPTMPGPLSGAITITDDAGNSPQVLGLTGNGTAPDVSLNPTSLTFPDQLVGGTSSPLTIALTNSGSSDLNIGSIVSSGDFAQTNDCGSVVAAGSSCTLTVTFTPSQVGAESGSITISDDAAGSPQIVPLSGNGT